MTQSILSEQENMVDSVELTEDIVELLDSWGWKQGFTHDIVSFAKLAIQCRSKKIGEILAVLKLAESDWIENRLKDKPQQVLTLDWLGLGSSIIKDNMNKILAIQFGVAYYENIFLGNVNHLVAENEEIRQHCSKYSSILIDINQAQPILVFSSLDQLQSYTQRSREDRSLDPILKALGTIEIVGALGSKQQIISTLSASVSENDRQQGMVTWSLAHAKTDAQKYVGYVLDSAIDLRANDISMYVDLMSKKGKIFFRKNTELMPCPVLNDIKLEVYQEMVRFLLKLARANPSGSRLAKPAGGQFPYKNNTNEFFIRNSFIPMDSIGNEEELISVDLRLLPRSIRNINLEDLGVHPIVIKSVKDAINLKKGLILVAGPTGSGKSTTNGGILGMHYMMYGNKYKRMELSNPIERVLPGVIPINLTDQMKSSGPNGFKSVFEEVLRHDPDVIFIGETRDTQTAEICTWSAITGHLTLSTIHADSAVLACRAIWNKVGEEWQFDVVEALTLIIGQRLVKRVCPHCNEGVRPLTVEEIEYFKYYTNINDISVEQPEETIIAHKAGCDFCSEGYIDVIPINDVLIVSRKVKEALLSGKNIDSALLRDYQPLSFFDSALYLMKQGKVDVNELYN